MLKTAVASANSVAVASINSATNVVTTAITEAGNLASFAVALPGRAVAIVDNVLKTIAG